MLKEKEKNIIHLITSLSNYIEKIRYELSMPYGLSNIQTTIIYDLYKHPNSKVTDICKRLDKSTNSISPLLNKLLNKGFIKKESSDIDARISYISLTDVAIKFINDLDNDILDYTEPMFKKLNDFDLDITKSNLELLMEVLKD